MTAKRKQRSYSKDDIRLAASLYAVNGNMSQTSRQTGFPRITVLDWRNNKNEYWVQQYNATRQEKTEEMRAKFADIIEKGIAELEKKIPNGNVSQLVIMIGTLFDKIRLLDMLPTSIPGKASSKKLDELAAQYEKIAEASRKKAGTNNPQNGSESPSTGVRAALKLINGDDSN
ncbi:hypothetical protein ACFL17_07145 [Pseudomonadota bacterium]